MRSSCDGDPARPCPNSGVRPSLCQLHGRVPSGRLKRLQQAEIITGPRHRRSLDDVGPALAGRVRRLFHGNRLGFIRRRLGCFVITIAIARGRLRRRIRFPTRDRRRRLWYRLRWRERMRLRDGRRRGRRLGLKRFGLAPCAPFGRAPQRSSDLLRIVRREHAPFQIEGFALLRHLTHPSSRRQSIRKTSSVGARSGIPARRRTTRARACGGRVTNSGLHANVVAPCVPRRLGREAQPESVLRHRCACLSLCLGISSSTHNMSGTSRRGHSSPSPEMV